MGKVALGIGLIIMARAKAHCVFLYGVSVEIRLTAKVGSNFTVRSATKRTFALRASLFILMSGY